MNAVASGVENIEELLLSPESLRQLVPTGPRLIADKTKSFKTIDSEDVQKRALAQADGKIITEQKTTTEHEIIVDDELPDNKSLGSQEQIKTVVSSLQLNKVDTFAQFLLSLSNRRPNNTFSNSVTNSM